MLIHTSDGPRGRVARGRRAVLRVSEKMFSLGLDFFSCLAIRLPCTDETLLNDWEICALDILSSPAEEGGKICGKQTNHSSVTPINSKPNVCAPSRFIPGMYAILYSMIRASVATFDCPSTSHSHARVSVARASALDRDTHQDSKCRERGPPCRVHERFA